MSKNALLRRTLETLLAPLGSWGGLADSWRDAVNRELRRWVETDCAFFRVSDGSPTRIDPLSQELLDARDAYREGGFRSLDPWAVRRVGPADVLVGSFRDLLGDDWRETSAYYRDFLHPHGITSYVGAQIGTDYGEHAVLSYFNMGKPEDEAVIARTRRRIHAVIPALKAGMEVWLTVRPRLDELGAMVDEVPEALLLCDENGRPVHANSALNRLLDADPEEARLRASLTELARDFSRGRAGDVHDLFSQAGEHTLHTSQGVYLVRPVVADERLRGGSVPEDEGVLLLVRRKHPSRSPPRDPPQAVAGEGPDA